MLSFFRGYQHTHSSSLHSLCVLFVWMCVCVCVCLVCFVCQMDWARGTSGNQYHQTHTGMCLLSRQYEFVMLRFVISSGGKASGLLSSRYYYLNILNYPLEGMFMSHIFIGNFPIRLKFLIFTFSRFRLVFLNGCSVDLWEGIKLCTLQHVYHSWPLPP